MGIAIYLLTFAILLAGLYAVVAKKNVIEIIVGAAILDYGINLFLVLIGWRTFAAAAGSRGGTAPILSPGQSGQQLLASAVDPLPQALILTSIVIALGMTALMVALALRLYEKYGTFDLENIRRLRG